MLKESNFWRPIAILLFQKYASIDRRLKISILFTI